MYKPAQVQLGVTTFITSINLYVLKVTVWVLFFICSLFKTTPIALLPFTTSYSGRVTITTKKNLQKRVIYLADTHTHTHTHWNPYTLNWHTWEFAFEIHYKQLLWVGEKALRFRASLSVWNSWLFVSHNRKELNNKTISLKCGENIFQICWYINFNTNHLCADHNQFHLAPSSILYGPPDDHIYIFQIHSYLRLYPIHITIKLILVAMQ